VKEASGNDVENKTNTTQHKTHKQFKPKTRKSGTRTYMTQAVLQSSYRNVPDYFYRWWLIG
jgi:hypothetical protein